MKVKVKNMIKTDEWPVIIAKLEQHGEAIVKLAKDIEKISDDKISEVTQLEFVTLEQVRAVLAEKSRVGHTDAIRNLLIKHGAKKLSEIDPEKYQLLLTDAEALQDG